MHLRSTLLPDPDGPMMPRLSPRSSCRSIPRNTCVEPKDFDTSRSSNRGLARKVQSLCTRNAFTNTPRQAIRQSPRTHVVRAGAGGARRSAPGRRLHHGRAAVLDGAARLPPTRRLPGANMHPNGAGSGRRVAADAIQLPPVRWQRGKRGRAWGSRRYRGDLRLRGSSGRGGTRRRAGRRRSRSSHDHELQLLHHARAHREHHRGDHVRHWPSGSAQGPQIAPQLAPR